MSLDPQDLPWRYRDDSYYQKGAFHVEFQIEPDGAANDLDETAQRSALQQLLLVLRDETGLKVSSFIDVWPREPDESTEPMESMLAEFVLYNKLGVTSLGKLRRFMDIHLVGDVLPRITLVDPESGQKFKTTGFTIRYLFHEFTAHQEPASWDRLRELMQQPDQGYQELMSGQVQLAQEATAQLYRFRGAWYRRAKRDVSVTVYQLSFDEYELAVELYDGEIVPYIAEDRGSDRWILQDETGATVGRAGSFDSIRERAKMHAIMRK